MSVVAAMVHFDPTLVQSARERATHARDKWETVPMALKSVTLLSWDVRYSVDSNGMLPRGLACTTD